MCHEKKNIFNGVKAVKFFLSLLDSFLLVSNGILKTYLLQWAACFLLSPWSLVPSQSWNEYIILALILTYSYYTKNKHNNSFHLKSTRGRAARYCSIIMSNNNVYCNILFSFVYYHVPDTMQQNTDLKNVLKAIRRGFLQKMYCVMYIVKTQNSKLLKRWLHNTIYSFSWWLINKCNIAKK